MARRGYTAILRQLKLLTVDTFRFQLEDGMDNIFSRVFLRFQSKKLIPNIRFPVESVFGTLIFKGKFMTVMVFGFGILILLFFHLFLFGFLYLIAFRQG